MKQRQSVKTVLLCSIFLTLSIALNAQKYKIKQADKKFENLEYIEAVKIYESVANKGYEDPDLYRKIGDAYYFNADYAQAAQWYDKLFTMSPGQTLEQKFRYGQSLKSIGKDTQANALLTEYYASKGINYSDLDKKIADYSDKYTIKKEDFNTENSDYPAFMDSEKLYLATAASNGLENNWSDERASDIYVVKGGDKQNLAGEINTKYNEGSLVITKDGNTMYFTRNDYNNKKRGKDADNTTKLKLYRAKKADGNWGDVEELPFNNSSYSVGHPALSKDEKMLYFVSDMPGGKGGTDIYSVRVSNDGGFDSPTNVQAINTPGNEMFPFMASDGTLYFSSNGYPNIGGLDVYSTAINNGGYGEVTNIGAPVNSRGDDFAFFIDGEEKGYFASNRENRNDDVYSFETNPNFKEPCELDLEGLVKDKDTGDLLADAVISLLDSKNEIVNRLKGGSDGAFSLEEINCNDVQRVRIERREYQTAEVDLPEPTDRKVYKDFLLERNEIPLETGTDIALLLKPIYFDLDKSYIRPDAEIELQKVVAIMKQHPTIKVNVGSHTDSRANDNYNMQLSQRRADATVDYLVSQGIDRSRLSGTGYGETQLVNLCYNGAACSESAHQQNRRSEFIVIK
ncbi:OmpA family protein [Galbibacter sp. EGI 63066]|uniref:OmpA family protein n=1 Tax=Galbibacter sp. EGI 63066 TaxID=2993559 RepID=UPI00224967AE|nr:OmpA family protein [Galbibacter sp. EGI 63066]MCX2679834.1 OmpA family protein [Galbibacter sp. EGI 63066]